MEEEKKKQYKRIRIAIQIFIIIILTAVTIFACIKLYPIFIRMQKDEIYLNETINKIKSFGHFSW